MKNKTSISLVLLALITILSCTQNKTIVTTNNSSKKENKKTALQTEQGVTKQQTHPYGGWFCPDNLNNFPSVNILDWEKVPVVNNRMPTQAETRNGTSLIFVDQQKYPSAKPMSLKMPKLARYYNEHSRKKELVIVIQAIQIQTDSIVGFRYLNGGNGSARFNEVNFLNNTEIKNLKPVQFVNQTITINANKKVIWDVLTNPEYYKILQPIFDHKNQLVSDWELDSKVNYKYTNAGNITRAMAQELYGNYYIQIDSENGKNQYVQKFMLLENHETKTTELKIVCGPFGNDFKEQEEILSIWAKEIKTLSEKKL